MKCRVEGNIFIAPDYNRRPPFSGFLPGVAGLRGCPVWCLYVNRGQCVASFGEDGREGAMMEYVPAVTAYEDTARKGFRTFIDTGVHRFEPFSPYDPAQEQELRVARGSIELKSRHIASGLEFSVQYAVLPEEDTGALMRRLTVKNASGSTVKLRLADGMARVIPGGIKNSEMREMANLTKSFFDVRTSESGLTLFASRSTTDNGAAVASVSRRHFYFAALGGEALPVSCNPEQLFGADTGLALPERFFAGEIPDEVPAPDRIPCAFAYVVRALAPGSELSVMSFAGFLDSGTDEQTLLRKFCNESWCEGKFLRAEQIAEDLSGCFELNTSLPVFDAYIGQCMMDNILRGGKPAFLGDKLLHVFGRRHGDLERDYNHFALEASYFSEGDGNFRDICQNRRNDVLFWPEVGKREVVEFIELIQLDGYNPLEIRPGRLKLVQERAEECARLIGAHAGELLPELEEGLSAGQIWSRLHAFGADAGGICESIARMCRAVPCHDFKDGYWIDHWTYIPDIVDSFLKIYPERQRELLVETFAASARIRARIRPFRDRIHMTPAGPRQYAAVCAGDAGGAGDEKMSIFAKLLLIAALKCATLDAEQSGLEMEAGKPGWNDALNGLPGLFGSSSSECADLYLLLNRLQNWCTEPEYTLPAALADFCRSLAALAREHSLCKEPSLQFWRESLKLRERWREAVYSAEADLSPAVVDNKFVKSVLEALSGLVKNGLARAVNARGMLDTYFINEPVFDACASPLSEDGVIGFKRRALPLFLEGQAKLLRLPDTDAVRLCRAVDGSGLFDMELNMYRLCAPLEGESMELGRIRAFSPGIFERESVFLHAELKYLLALFDSGLYPEFFERLKTVLPPFLDPEVYGRSTMENCSYIVSSAHPDSNLHGRGFQPRLSGSTAEMLSLWQRMFLGRKMFYMDKGELCFEPRPVLAGWFFHRGGFLSFRYLNCDFEYLNVSRRNTYGENGVSVLRVMADGETMPNGTLRGAAAVKLRNKGLGRLTVELA